MHVFGHDFSGVVGAVLTLISVVIAALSHPIPALQNAASIFAIVVGTVTLINLVRKWNK